jgi:hypothetical protein
MVSDGELGTAGMADIRGKAFDCRRGKRFFASPKRPSSSGANPASYSVGRSGCLSDRSIKLTTGAEVKKSVAVFLVAVDSS